MSSKQNENGLSVEKFFRRDARHSAEKHFVNWYRQQSLPWVKERVLLFASRVSVSPAKLAIRELSYRWGSCGRSGTISFHWKLFQLPVCLVDYVILHELVHLAEPHHGPRFYACLERALPDWQERKEALAQWASGYLSFNE